MATPTKQGLALSPRTRTAIALKNLDLIDGTYYYASVRDYLPARVQAGRVFPAED